MAAGARTIHPISRDDLEEAFLREHVYPNTSRTLYWSREWDPDFYVALAQAGFISISHQHPDLGPVLIPELQERYSVLDWKRLHVSRNVRKLRRSGRLEDEGVELRVTDPSERVVERLLAYHGGETWLSAAYCELLAKLPRDDDPAFSLHGIELWSRRREKLVAGELGYTTGSVYTSLSGFCTRPDPEWRHFGTLQLVLLADELRDRGYAFWNLGHAPMAYKTALGARTLARRSFLPRWLRAVSRAPSHRLSRSA
jgi:Leu/Phe-tRNA-protein transferase